MKSFAATLLLSRAAAGWSGGYSSGSQYSGSSLSAYRGLYGGNSGYSGYGLTAVPVSKTVLVPETVIEKQAKVVYDAVQKTITDYETRTVLDTETRTITEQVA